MLSKTTKLIVKGIAVASAAGYIAADQIAERRAGEFVVMRDPSSSVSYSQSALTAQAQKVGSVVRSGTRTVTVKTTKSGADSLRKPGLIVEPVLAYSVPKPVRANAWMSCDGPSPAPRPTPPPPPPGDEKVDWGVNRVHSLNAYANGNLASNVKVCVLDTGADREHPDLVLTGGANFTDSGPQSDYQDRHGHGTHTTGLVGATWKNGLGVTGASQAKLYIGKVLSDEGYGYNDWIAEGILWSVNQGCTIISMSLGGPERSSVIESAIVYAGSRGAKIIAAAGNESSNDVGYPAGYNYPGIVFSVSATTRTDELADFSNFGKVEMACPGEGIYSTVPGGYDTYSGTSMATPICAGVIALFEAAGKEIQYNEIGSATLFGRGIPDATRAFKE